MNDSDLLKYIIDNGMIDISVVCKEVKMKEDKRFLKQHQNKIFKNKRGQYCTYLTDEHGKRFLRSRKDKRELEQLIIEHYKTDADNPSVSMMFHSWITDRVERKKISLSTRDKNTNIFNKHFKEFGKLRIEDISPDDMNMFLESQIPEYEMTAKAFANLKGITKGIFKYAKRKGFIMWDVETALHDLDVSDRDFRKVIKEDYEEVYTDDEIKILMNHCLNNLDDANCALILLFATGMRVGEVCTLKHEDIFLDRVNIRRTETRFKVGSGKYKVDVKEFPKTSASVRTVIVPKEYEWLMKRIKLLNPFSEWVFMYNDARMKEKKVEDRLRWLCKKYNIYHKSPHKIRKTYISILLDNGVDSRMVQDQVGHADISVSENFYHRNRKKIEQKQEILSSITELSNIC